MGLSLDVPRDELHMRKLEYKGGGQESGSFPKLGDPNIDPKPQNIIVRIIGTPKMVPLILGNPQV